MAANEMTIKLMVDTESNRLIFAEASKDFVDFLFFLLSLPIGAACKFISNELMVGSIGNIHTSVSNLEETYLQPDASKYSLLSPVFFSSLTNINPLMISELTMISSGKLYNCGDPNCKQGVTNICRSAQCPGCNRTMKHEIKFIPSSDDLIMGNDQVSEEGYVQEVVSYLISDDLTVTPISAMAVMSIMNKCNVSKFEEKEVKFGTVEAMDLLNTSFHSTTVLTDVFLKSKKKNQPNPVVGQGREKIQIFVKNTVTGRTRTVEVERSVTTIARIKAEVVAFDMISSDNQRLFFAGKELEDSRTLADYNVHSDSTFHLVQPSGMEDFSLLY